MSACRYKVFWLKKKFVTPLEAEVQFPPKVVMTRDSSTQTERHVHDPLSNEVWSSLDRQEQIQGISTLFSRYCLKEFCCVVPGDFLVYASLAIQRLTNSARSNILYSLARSIGTMREDRTDSLLPVNRMPFGLLEFIANFFIAKDSREVSMMQELWVVIGVTLPSNQVFFVYNNAVFGWVAGERLQHTL